MHCPEARALLPLYAGNDLADVDRPALEEHLARCPRCQHDAERCVEVVTALRSASESELPVRPLVRSVWPGVRGQLVPYRSVDASVAQRKFNGWVPALALSLAAAAVFVAIGDRPAASHQSLLPTENRAGFLSSPDNLTANADPSDATEADTTNEVDELRRVPFDRAYRVNNAPYPTRPLFGPRPIFDNIEF